MLLDEYILLILESQFHREEENELQEKIDELWKDKGNLIFYTNWGLISPIPISLHVLPCINYVQYKRGCEVRIRYMINTSEMCSTSEAHLQYG